MNSTLVIIPTYNERQNIGRLIPLILEKDETIEVLVVDDSSPDGTADVVKALQKRDGRVRLIERPRKDGLGKAYVHAFKHALSCGFERIISMDGDFSHDPMYLGRMMTLLDAHDVIIGSRYAMGGGTENWSIWRRILSRAGNMYAGMVLSMPISDYSAGFVGYRAEVLKAIPLDQIRSEGYSFLMEMKFWSACLGFNLVEMPIVFTERRQGRSKISRAILFEAIWVVWRLRLKVPAQAAMIRRGHGKG